MSEAAGDLNGVNDVAMLSGLNPSCRPQSKPIGVRDAANGLDPENAFESIELSVTAPHGVRATPLKGVEASLSMAEFGMKSYIVFDTDSDTVGSTSAVSEKWIERVPVPGALLSSACVEHDSALDPLSARDDDGWNPLHAKGEIDTRLDFMSLIQPEFDAPLVKQNEKFI